MRLPVIFDGKAWKKRTFDLRKNNMLLADAFSHNPKMALARIGLFLLGLLYLSTMFLGLLLGVLCDANTIMDPKILPLLLLGILSLIISGIGGIMAGYILYFISGGKCNPAVGIAGVSCVPTMAKVAQKLVSKVNKMVIILPEALGANVSGVITTAIIAGIFCSLLAK